MNYRDEAAEEKNETLGDLSLCRSLTFFWAAQFVRACKLINTAELIYARVCNRERVKSKDCCFYQHNNEKGKKFIFYLFNLNLLHTHFSTLTEYIFAIQFLFKL